MPPGKGMGSGARRMSAAPRTSKKTRTTRGPQGLEIQASSPQRSTPPPRQSRPAPSQQPGPIRQSERPAIRRQQRADRKQAVQARRRNAEYQERVRAALGTDVIGNLRRPAQQAVSRAQARAPERPLPSVPVLRQPTSRQIRETKRLFAKSLAGQSQDARHGIKVGEEMRADPRSAAKLTALDIALAQEQSRLTSDPARRYKMQEAVRRQQQLGMARAESGEAPPQVAGVSLGAIESLADAVSDKIQTGPGVAATRFVTKDAPKFLGNIGSDVANFPRNAILGTYEIGAAGVEAAQGDTDRAEKLIGALDEGALGNVLRGNFKEASKQFGEHPLYAGLEITGAGQIVGRTAGAGLRAAGAQAGSTKRAPLELAPGTNLKVERSYSPNALVKAAQVIKDRRTGNVASGGQRSRELNRAVDEFAAQEEALRRGTRAEAVKTSKKILGRESRRKPEQAVAQLAVERVLTKPENLRRDITREIDRLSRVYTAESHTMSAGARKANREQRAALAAVLDNPQALARSEELFARAGKYTDEAAKIEQQLIKSGVLDPQQALNAKLRTYAVRVMGARPNKVEGRKTPIGLVDDNGKPVTSKQILEHMRENDVPLPGFATQRRDQSGAKSFFVNWAGQSRKTADPKKRSGEGARLGAYATGHQALQENMVRTAGLAEAVQGFDRFVGQFGVKRPDGKAFTTRDAERVAGELEERTGMQWVPIRAAPARYGRERLEKILNEQGSGAAPALDSFMDDLLAKATSPDEADNVVLVPEQAVGRFREHQQLTPSTVGKVGDVVTSAFRTTVLPLSTKWITGNIAEAVVRLATAGTTPADVVRGAKVMSTLRKLDEEAYTKAHARLRGGLLIGSADKLNVRRTSEAFKGTVLEQPARAAGTVRRTPVVKQTIDGINVLTGAVFNFNKRFEQLAQTAAIGRQSRRHVREFSESWTRSLMLQRKAYEEVAEGLLNTDTQIRFARSLDETLGKYNRFGPGMRRMTQSMMPFLPWFVNAGRFTMYTLPVKHPVKSAVLTSVERQFEEEWKEQQKQIPPGDLRYAIRRKDGGLVNLARYTPFGVWTGGPETITEPLLPQISSVAHILAGRSFTGKPLQLEGGPEEREKEGKRIWLALYSALESTIPGIQLGRRLSEGGETAYDDSTIFDTKTKSGTAYGSTAPDRVFNPLRPTYLSPPESSSTAKGTKGTGDPLLDARLEAAESRSTSIDPDILDARLRALGR